MYRDRDRDRRGGGGGRGEEKRRGYLASGLVVGERPKSDAPLWFCCNYFVVLSLDGGGQIWQVNNPITWAIDQATVTSGFVLFVFLFFFIIID